MTSMPPTDSAAFYATFIERNEGLLTAEEQRVLRSRRFVIAGCGSTGGACVMPLVRSGAEHLVLLDPGEYDLNNLNRQDASLAEVGQNKAVVQANHVFAVNPFAEVEVHADGVLPATIGGLLRPGDIVIDAVDVTTRSGVEAKLALHSAACTLRLQVLTAYDIGTTQYLELFDYRHERRPLRGLAPPHPTPDQLLRALIPVRALPRRIFGVLRQRASEPDRSLPQLMMTSTLLGALVVPYLLRVALGRPVRRRLWLDVEQPLRPASQQVLELIGCLIGIVRLWSALRKARPSHV
ncbi:MAG TPA: ThiF family adenylyltransferase [Chloroflexota bacterium]|jgi:molybdopterin/thiamine biosynthesis adenylyltransferase